jgi:hypothetical protein
MFMYRYIKTFRYLDTYNSFDTYGVCRDHELVPAKTLPTPQDWYPRPRDGDSLSKQQGITDLRIILVLLFNA